jgi:hypothetical protein
MSDVTRQYLRDLEDEVNSEYQQNRNYMVYLKGMFKLMIYYVRWKISR